MVREFLRKETERAGFGGVDIQRTPMGTRITLVAERPGFVIGRRGATIKKLTEDLQTKFKLDNPQIDVQESSNPSINASIMAMKLAEALERGWHFRRAGHSTLRRIMDGGARGCQITIGGKLTGGRSRMEKFTAGHIKHCGEPALMWMDIGYAVARKKLGCIGVKVAIMDPKAKLPDEVVFKSAEPAAQAVAAAPPAPVAPAAPAAAAPAPAAPEAPTEEPTAPTGPVEHVTDLPGVGSKKAEALKDAGYTDLDSLRRGNVDEIAAVTGIGDKLAKKIKHELERMGGE